MVSLGNSWAIVTTLRANKIHARHIVLGAWPWKKHAFVSLVSTHVRMCSFLQRFLCEQDNLKHKGKFTFVRSRCVIFGSDLGGHFNSEKRKFESRKNLQAIDLFRRILRKSTVLPFLPKPPGADPRMRVVPQHTPDHRKYEYWKITPLILRCICSNLPEWKSGPLEACQFGHENHKDLVFVHRSSRLHCILHSFLEVPS